MQTKNPDSQDPEGQLSANRLQKKFNDLKMAGEFLSDFVVKDPSLGCEFLAPTEVPKQRPGPLPTASASLDADLLFFQLPDGIFRHSEGRLRGFPDVYTGILVENYQLVMYIWLNRYVKKKYQRSLCPEMPQVKSAGECLSSVDF